MKKDRRRRSFFTFKLFPSRNLQEQVSATIAGAVLQVRFEKSQQIQEQ